MSAIKTVAVVLFLLPAASGAAAIEVHGHRGARARVAENTLPAFEEALRIGVDVLEFDLGVTKDGVVVVSHDQSLGPVACLAPGGKSIEKPVPIRSLTLEEVRAYDCGSVPNPRFPRQRRVPGTKVPTLEEVFSLVERSTHPAARRVGFNIETKIVPGLPDMSPAPEEFSRLVVEVVRRHGFSERTIVQSFDYRTLLAVKAADPRIRTSMLTSDNLMDMVGVARGAKADILSPYYPWITRETVDALHRAGVRVAPWTVNEPEAWEALLGYGVDAIITDDPEALIAYLKTRRKP